MNSQRKLLHLIAVLSFVMAVSGQPPQGDNKWLNVCVYPFNCTVGNIGPNPEDCKTYFNCTGDVLYLTHCDPGDVFNPNINECQFTYKPDLCVPLNCPNGEDYKKHIYTPPTTTSTSTTEPSTSTTTTTSSSTTETTTTTAETTSSSTTTQSTAITTETTESVPGVTSSTVLSSSSTSPSTSISPSTSESTSDSTSSSASPTISSSSTSLSPSPSLSTSESTISSSTSMSTSSTSISTLGKPSDSTSISSTRSTTSPTNSSTTGSISTSQSTSIGTSSVSPSSLSATPTTSISTTLSAQPWVSLTQTLPVTGGGVVVEGDRVVYQCNFFYGQAPGMSGIQSLVNFQWKIGERNIMPSSSSRVKINTKGSQSTLVLSPARPYDTGLIECYANYYNNFAEKDGKNLTVLTKPVVSIYPVKVFIKAGRDYSLNCTLISGVTDQYNTSLVWFENDQPVLSGGKYNITQSSVSSILTVSDFPSVRSLRTNYSCMGINPVTGNSTRETSEVIVLLDYDLGCAAEIDPVLRISWKVTANGEEAVEPCPAGKNGFVTRLCQESKWKNPNDNGCVSKEISSVLSQLAILQDGIGADNSTVVAEVATSVQNFTENQADTGFNVGDLRASVDAIGGLAEVRNSTVPTSADKDYMTEIRAVVNSVSNVIGSSSRSAWENILQTLNSTVNMTDQSNPAVSLLSATDTYGQVLNGQTKTKGSQTVSSPNLVLSAVTVEWSALNATLIMPMERSQGWNNPDDSLTLSKQTLPQNPNISVWSSYYRNLDFLLNPLGSWDIIGSRILSVSVKELEGLKGLTPKINITLTHNKTDMNATCVYWQFKTKDTGYWSTDGCEKVGGNETHTFCQCDHLTNFAILMSRNPTDGTILSIISVVGCCISIAAMVLTIIFYCLLWKHVRSHHAVVLINLCIALIVANALFIGGVDKTDNKVACTVIAALLHYFYLAAFFLMLAEGVEMLLYIVFVFHVRRKMETALLVFAGWLAPAVIVGISLGVTQTEGYGDDKSCWLSVKTGLLWAFVGPAFFVCLANLIIIIVVLVRISQSRFQVDKNEKKNRIKSSVWNILVICPILGTTWIFGVLSLAFSSVVFQYIFAVSNSLQGLFIFIFHVLFNNRKTKGKLILSSSCLGRDTTKTNSRSSNSGGATTSRTQRPGPVTGTSSGSAGPSRSISYQSDATEDKSKTVSSDTTVKTDITMLESITVRTVEPRSGVINGESNGYHYNTNNNNNSSLRNAARFDEESITDFTREASRNNNGSVGQYSVNSHTSRNDSGSSNGSGSTSSSSGGDSSSGRIRYVKVNKGFVDENKALLNGSAPGRRLDSVQEHHDDNSVSSSSDDNIPRAHSTATLTNNADRINVDNTRSSRVSDDNTRSSRVSYDLNNEFSRLPRMPVSQTSSGSSNTGTIISGSGSDLVRSPRSPDRVNSIYPSRGRGSDRVENTVTRPSPKKLHRVDVQHIGTDHTEYTSL